MSLATSIGHWLRRYWWVVVLVVVAANIVGQIAFRNSHGFAASWACVSRCPLLEKELAGPVTHGLWIGGRLAAFGDSFINYRVEGPAGGGKVRSRLKDGELVAVDVELDSGKRLMLMGRCEGRQTCRCCED